MGRRNPARSLPAGALEALCKDKSISFRSDFIAKWLLAGMDQKAAEAHWTKNKQEKVFLNKKGYDQLAKAVELDAERLSEWVSEFGKSTEEQRAETVLGYEQIVQAAVGTSAPRQADSHAIAADAQPHRVFPNCMAASLAFCAMVEDRVGSGSSVAVKWLGMSMRYGAPTLSELIRKHREQGRNGLRVQICMFDPDWDGIAGLNPDWIAETKASHSTLCRCAAAVTDSQHIELSLYRFLTEGHGFMIDDRFLFLSDFMPSKTGLLGGENEYHFFDSQADAKSAAVVGNFQTWFQACQSGKASGSQTSAPTRLARRAAPPQKYSALPELPHNARPRSTEVAPWIQESQPSSFDTDFLWHQKKEREYVALTRAGLYDRAASLAASCYNQIPQESPLRWRAK